jgi:hypothetical protein
MSSDTGSNQNTASSSSENDSFGENNGGGGAGGESSPELRKVLERLAETQKQLQDLSHENKTLKKTTHEQTMVYKMENAKHKERFIEKAKSLLGCKPEDELPSDLKGMINFSTDDLAGRQMHTFFKRLFDEIEQKGSEFEKTFKDFEELKKEHTKLNETMKEMRQKKHQTTGVSGLFDSKSLSSSTTGAGTKRPRTKEDDSYSGDMSNSKKVRILPGGVEDSELNTMSVTGSKRGDDGEEESEADAFHRIILGNLKDLPISSNQAFVDKAFRHLGKLDDGNSNMSGSVPWRPPQPSTNSFSSASAQGEMNINTMGNNGQQGYPGGQAMPSFLRKNNVY